MWTHQQAIWWDKPAFALMLTWVIPTRPEISLSGKWLNPALHLAKFNLLFMSALHICKVQGFYAPARPCQVGAHMWLPSSNSFLINFTWKNMCDRFRWWLNGNRAQKCSLLDWSVLKFCWCVFFPLKKRGMEKSPLISFKHTHTHKIGWPTDFIAPSNYGAGWNMYNCSGLSLHLHPPAPL